MSKLKIHPNNRKYYSEEFIQGWERGVQNQFDADVDFLEDLLDKIRAEIENITPKCQIRTGKTSIDTEMMIPQEKVLQIIDKYR